jgi:hypothetical protein
LEDVSRCPKMSSGTYTFSSECISTGMPAPSFITLTWGGTRERATVRGGGDERLRRVAVLSGVDTYVQSQGLRAHTAHTAQREGCEGGGGGKLTVPVAMLMSTFSVAMVLSRTCGKIA